MSFEYLGLSDDVLRAVAEAGYSEPTPIQRQAIPTVLQGRDVLGIAQTGTGKTASFTLPMLDILSMGRARARMPRSLIIEPTRELAAQVAESFERYGKYSSLSMALLIGGVSFEDQDRKLDRGVDVLIATPGRLLDHFERGKLMLTGVKILVIDEADRMLDMGFIPDVERICKLIPIKPQTLFFSATMPKEIRRLADAFLDDPKEIAVAPPATTAENVEQRLVIVPERDKRRALRELLRRDEVHNAIIFCNRKRDVDVLYKSLVSHGFSAAALHGDMDQFQRMKVLAEFKDAQVELLVASDVAARGLDIPAVSHIFNFDVPLQAEDYVHRIGRTGRAGRSGRAYIIATPDDGKYVDAVRKLTGQDIPLLRLDGFAAVDFEESPRGRGRGRGGGRARESGARAEAGSDTRKRRRRGGRRDTEAGAEAVAPAPAAADQPAPDAGEAASETAAPEAAPEGAPRKRRRRGGRRRSQRADTASGQTPAAAESQSNQQPRKRESKPEPGLGDDLPGFMKRTLEQREARKKKRRPRGSDTASKKGS